MQTGHSQHCRNLAGLLNGYEMDGDYKYCFKMTCYDCFMLFKQKKELWPCSLLFGGYNTYTAIYMLLFNLGINMLFKYKELGQNMDLNAQLNILHFKSDAVHHAEPEYPLFACLALLKNSYRLLVI